MVPNVMTALKQDGLCRGLRFRMIPSARREQLLRTKWYIVGDIKAMLMPCPWLPAKGGRPQECNQRESGSWGWNKMQSMRCDTEGEKDEVEEDYLSQLRCLCQEIVDMWF